VGSAFLLFVLAVDGAMPIVKVVERIVSEGPTMVDPLVLLQVVTAECGHILKALFAQLEVPIVSDAHVLFKIIGGQK